MADTVEELKHAIIEDAKAAYKEDESLPFVRYLEISARKLAPGWWCEAYVVRGVWHFNLAPSGPLISNDQAPLF